jgi:hypothetical protein
VLSAYLYGIAAVKLDPGGFALADPAPLRRARPWRA